MKRVIQFFSILAGITFFALCFFTKNTYAQQCLVTTDPSSLSESTPEADFMIGPVPDLNASYEISVSCGLCSLTRTSANVVNGLAVGNIHNDALCGCAFDPGTRNVTLYLRGSGTVCSASYSVGGGPPPSGCSITVSPSNPGINDTLEITGQIANYGSFPQVMLHFQNLDTGRLTIKAASVSGNSFSLSIPASQLSGVGNYRVDVVINNVFHPCSTTFPICLQSGCPQGPPATHTIQEICKVIQDSSERGQCEDCMKNGNSWTALKCLPTGNLDDFIGWFLTRGIGIAGGIALLLMIFGAIKIITSAGNPEGVKTGGEIITAAVSGLLFIIFCIFLLKLIGVDILQLPEFGSP